MGSQIKFAKIIVGCEGTAINSTLGLLCQHLGFISEIDGPLTQRENGIIVRILCWSAALAKVCALRMLLVYFCSSHQVEILFFVVVNFVLDLWRPSDSIRWFSKQFLSRLSIYVPRGSRLPAFQRLSAVWPWSEQRTRRVVAPQP